MKRILLCFFLILVFNLDLLANTGKNYSIKGSSDLSSLPSFQSITNNNQKNIIFWESNSTFGEDAPRFFLQQTNTIGELLWGKDVELSAGNKHIQSAHKMISDGLGGIIIAWEAKRQGENDTDLYIQKIDSTGLKLWGDEGRLVCTASGSQITPFIITDDAGGAFIAWSDSRNDATYSNWDIYAQHVSADGSNQWATEGIVISADQKDEFIGTLLPLKDGGITVVWNMVVPGATGSDEGYDFYSRQFDENGEWRYSLNAPFLSLAAGNIDYALATEILNDGAGGFFLSIISNAASSQRSLYIQHVLSNGQSAFQEKGLFIDSLVSDVQQLSYKTDSLGNYVITWLGRKDTSLLTCISTFDRLGNTLTDTTISNFLVPETSLASNGADSLTVNPTHYATLNMEFSLKSPPDKFHDSNSASTISPPQNVTNDPPPNITALTASPGSEVLATKRQTPQAVVRYVSVPVKTIEAAVALGKNYSVEYRLAARKSFHVSDLRPETLLSQTIKNNIPADYTFKVSGLAPDLRLLHLLPD